VRRQETPPCPQVQPRLVFLVTRVYPIVFLPIIGIMLPQAPRARRMSRVTCPAVSRATQRFPVPAIPTSTSLRSKSARPPAPNIPLPTYDALTPLHQRHTSPQKPRTRCMSRVTPPAALQLPLFRPLPVFTRAPRYPPTCCSPTLSPRPPPTPHPPRRCPRSAGLP
jgi:hypothetical protein